MSPNPQVVELLRDPVTGTMKHAVNTEGSACPSDDSASETVESSPSVKEAFCGPHVAPAAVKDVGRMRDLLLSLSREQQAGRLMSREGAP